MLLWKVTLYAAMRPQRAGGETVSGKFSRWARRGNQPAAAPPSSTGTDETVVPMVAVTADAPVAQEEEKEGGSEKASEEREEGDEDVRHDIRRLLVSHGRRPLEQLFQRYDLDASGTINSEVRAYGYPPSRGSNPPPNADPNLNPNQAGTVLVQGREQRKPLALRSN